MLRPEWKEVPVSLFTKLFGLGENDQYNEGMITEEMTARVEEAKARIIAGEIVVPKE